MLYLKDKTISTSKSLLDQNCKANDVDIRVFEPTFLFHPPRSISGEIRNTWRNHKTLEPNYVFSYQARKAYLFH